MNYKESKDKYYIRLFEKEEHLLEFCNGNCLYMNNIKNFSKYDDELINDVTEGRVCNKNDDITITLDGKPAGHNISILIPNWYVYCLFELFEEDYTSDGNNINITGEKFGQFVTSYMKEKDKCFIAVIDAAKFDYLIKSSLKDINNNYCLFKRVEFTEYDLIKRMESYFNGNVKPLLFQKRSHYKQKLSEKRLAIFFPKKEEEKNFIRLDVQGIDNTVIFKGIIDKNTVQKYNKLHKPNNFL